MKRRHFLGQNLSITVSKSDQNSPESLPMPSMNPAITLDRANRVMVNISIPQALAKLNYYATLDSGELYVALSDGVFYYTTDAARPQERCEVWVMSGQQPISSHGMESDAAYASACTALLGLRIARAYVAKEADTSNNKPWLDDLSLVMLYASRVEGNGLPPLPLTKAMFDLALQHGVNMKYFTVAQNGDEHF